MTTTGNEYLTRLQAATETATERFKLMYEAMMNLTVEELVELRKYERARDRAVARSRRNQQAGKRRRRR